MNVYDPKAPKKAVNLSLNSDLLAKARELGVNLSGEMETRLEEIVRNAERERWQEANQAAFDAHNQRIATYGIWSAGKRRF
jgi:antitoxin CcdA